MPSIPNSLPPQAGERSRRAEQYSRNTPSDGASFDDYLSNASAAATATPSRSERKPERSEKPEAGDSAQSKTAPTNSDQQPVQPEGDADETPVVDGTEGAGAAGVPLPIPVCLAPQTPPPIERPVGGPIQQQPQTDGPDITPKLKAGAQWGPGPLRPGPGAATNTNDPVTPKEPPICTGGPGGNPNIKKIDVPIQTVKEPVQAQPDGEAPAPVDQSKPQPKEPATTPKPEQTTHAEKPETPVKAEKPAESPHAEKPARVVSRAETTVSDAKPELTSDNGDRTAGDSSDQPPVRGKVEGGQQSSGRGPERMKVGHAGKPNEAMPDTLKHVLTDMKVVGIEDSRVDSQGAFNPAAEIGRFLVPIDSAPHSAPSVAAVGSEKAERPAVLGGEPAGAAGTGLKASATDASPSPGGGDANIERLAKVLSGSRNESNWRVALQLDPPEMGRLHIHARMEDGGLSLSVAADNEPVRRAIESRMGELRDALSEHGIRLDATDVRVRAGSEPGNGATREHTSGGQSESPARGFSQGQSSQGQASNRGDGGSWQTPSGFGQSYGGESRQSNSGWGGPMGLADVAATSETSVDLVA